MSADWSWQATQALLQRLQQPSPATVEAEYDNIQKLDTFDTAKAPAPGCRLTALPLSQQQYATLMWQWCGVAKQLLGLLADPASAQSPSAVLVAGNLLSVLAVSLEMWIGATAGEVAQAALKQQIAQHTSGLVPLLGKLMAAVAAAVRHNIAERQRKARNPESVQDKAKAAHARGYFPHHTDIVLGLHLLVLWNALAGNRPGTLLHTSSSSSSSSSSSGSDSSTGLQQAVLPGCELAVSILKTWPPNIASSIRSSSSSRQVLDVPDGAIPRCNVTNIVFAMANVLLGSIRSELFLSQEPFSAADDTFVGQLSASAAAQHLLLLEVAFSCQRLHKQQQGMSHFQAKDAMAAVTGSKQRAAAAAAAAAEAVTAGSSSSSSTQKQQQQYLAVPAHHTAVLELLLVPEDSLTFQLPSGFGSCAHLASVLTTFTEFVSGLLGSVPGSREYGPPKVPVELCAPLHCMLAEAVALAPGSALYLRSVLAFMQALQDVYFKAKLGTSPEVPPEVVNAAVVGYRGALNASLQLLGPAVLHSYKHVPGSQGDTLQLPPGSFGCPLGDDRTPLTGAPIQDASLNLFGTLTVKLGAGAQDVITAAFQQQPFSTAAVCEVAIRGAARHNELSLERVRVFAALTMMALNESCEEAEPVGSSTCGAMVAAAASDRSTRDALLLQHGLIMTQLKHASISCGGTSVFSGLFHHLVPTVRALVRLTSHIDHRFNSSSGSSSSGGVEKQRVQLQTLLPWVHLCGRCMFFAGSQLLRVMEEPAATEAPGLRDGCPIAVQQVLQVIMLLLLMVADQLQQLQAEGICIMQGPPDAAHKALKDLLDSKLAAVTQEWDGALHSCEQAVSSLQQRRAATGSNGGWGSKLQQMLQSVVGTKMAAALRAAGAAVCAEFPLKLCCNNPGCTSMAKVGEMPLGSSCKLCSGCKAARYCSNACQDAAWKMGHKKVCKRITKAAAAVAAAGGTA